jgi:hypothetical protein
MNNKRNYISTYIFILSSFCLVLFLAYNNTEKDIMSISNNKTEQFWVENDTNQPVLITNSLEIESNQINDNVDIEDTNEFNLSENEDDID